MYYNSTSGGNSSSSQQQSWESTQRQSSNSRAKSRRQHGNRHDRGRDLNSTGTEINGNRKQSVGFATLKSHDHEEKHSDDNSMEMPRIKTPQIRSTGTLSPAKEPSRKSSNRHSSGTRGSRRGSRGEGDDHLSNSNSAPQLPQIAGASSAGKGRPHSSASSLLQIVTEEHSTACVSSIKGLKPGNPNWTNQDNFLVMERFDNRDVNIYCVLDGHGESGHLVSRKCRESLPQHLRTSALDMKRAFSLMQSDLNASDIDVRCSGATCVVVTMSGNRLEVSNCGDSRAVLGRRTGNGSYVPIQLTNDHKPDKPEERKRILSCGGHLGCRQVMVNQGPRGPVTVPVGPTRVWYQYRGDTLGLAMSRSLGDSVVHRSGVSAEPEIIDHIIEPDCDDFVIIATDGIWDVVDNAQAVQMIQTFAAKSSNWSAMDAASWLSKFARSRWEKLSPMVDDITCIIVKLGRALK
eukprot:CAMPEP_0182417246 /NCGR_PEP_ID=MMETSP1167-20130531/1678_1 /TAXON_ID=2988 /ORGANISM="Mallomonas Sp, Strain CCMP3275" /LENGTH=461 /DNA_ID=CAMNT_0024590659 /DNA_START=296 /DNA_END=1681 /DNA_ORIENTATION=-